MKAAPLGPPTGMSNHVNGALPADPVDELVHELLECGAVLSQIIGHMVENRDAGRSAPDAAPIPEIAHSVIHSTMRRVRKGHSKRDIRVAATIIGETTEAMCEEIFFVDPDSGELGPP